MVAVGAGSIWVLVQRVVRVTKRGGTYREEKRYSCASIVAEFHGMNRWYSTDLFLSAYR